MGTTANPFAEGFGTTESLDFFMGQTTAGFPDFGVGTTAMPSFGVGTTESFDFGNVATTEGFDFGNLATTEGFDFPEVATTSPPFDFLQTTADFGNFNPQTTAASFFDQPTTEGLDMLETSAAPTEGFEFGVATTMPPTLGVPQTTAGLEFDMVTTEGLDFDVPTTEGLNFPDPVPTTQEFPVFPQTTDGLPLLGSIDRCEPLLRIGKFGGNFEIFWLQKILKL